MSLNVRLVRQAEVTRELSQGEPRVDRKGTDQDKAIGESRSIGS